MTMIMSSPDALLYSFVYGPSVPIQAFELGVTALIPRLVKPKLRSLLESESVRAVVRLLGRGLARGRNGLDGGRLRFGLQVLGVLASMVVKAAVHMSHGSSGCLADGNGGQHQRCHCETHRVFFRLGFLDVRSRKWTNWVRFAKGVRVR